jgi:hypothetical protein
MRRLQFARTEGILPAPESSHAIRAAVDEAPRRREEGRARTILFCLSGHGHFDLAAYENYLSGRLQDYEYPGRDLATALARRLIGHARFAHRWYRRSRAAERTSSIQWLRMN